MPPPASRNTDLPSYVDGLINENKIMVFSKTTCGFCTRVKQLFRKELLDFEALELDKIENGPQIQELLQTMSGQKTVPNVYINGKHLGGCDSTESALKSGELRNMLKEKHDFEYDLVVVGGGSGGLAASKEAAAQGLKVACLDFVKPSPLGTTWGLGGTCVNVGCIPKKLMHQAALLGEAMKDAPSYGWQLNPETVEHNWATMRQAIQDHIGSLNWGYRVALRDKNVKYLNAYGEFVGQHTMKTTTKSGKVQEITSNSFLIATGGRPNYPDIPGIEHCISSDDLFSLAYSPGKTVVIGASYVALECAGFLHGIGLEVEVMVRSILLRGFDQQCAEKIGQYMESHGVKFVRPCVPTKIEQVRAPTDTEAGLLRVTPKHGDKEVVVECNSVLMAVGRSPCTSGMGLENVGVQLNKSQFILADDDEKTNVDNIYAIGDVIEGRPELTPVAIQAGRLLARRLAGVSKSRTDYDNVPTTVFTPLEYGACGLAEEVAEERFGADDIETYHGNFTPLEWTLPHREENVCYAKLVCVKSQNERVVGFHVLGPNAGEITQGFALGIKMGATKADFANTIGIHPTCAEGFTSLNITKRSGEDIASKGC